MENVDDLREIDKMILLVILLAIVIVHRFGTLEDLSLSVVMVKIDLSKNNRLMKIGLKKRDKFSSYCLT